MSDSVWPHRRQPTRLPHPWDSPGKNTGVGCHFLLQCTKVKSESEVTLLCPTLSDPMDCSPSGSSVHGMIHSAFSNLLKNLVEFHCLYGGPIFLLLFVLIPLLLWRHLSFLRFQADWPVTWGHWWIKEKLWFHRYFSLIVSVGWLSFQLLPY